MDSVTTLAPSAAVRYQGAARNADDPAHERAAAANAQPQQPQSTTVTLSRRAQELAAREAQDDARAAAEAQQSASAADAAQEARRTQTAQADQTAQAAQANERADIQLRRAYADPDGAAAR